MHKKLFLVLLLLCVMIPQAAFSDTYEEREGRGLEILSDPSNARVYINGIEWGRTPLMLPDLMPGTYMVLLVRESYEDRQLVLSVPRRGMLTVSLDMEKAMGTLLILPVKSPDISSLVPFDPEIFVDGELQSETTLSLPVGFQTILVRAFGYQDVSATVMIVQDRTQRLELEMLPALYRLSNAVIRRSRFNPANSGSLGIAECVFEVNAPGQGIFTVTNSQDLEVYSENLEVFTSRSQTAAWNGKSQNGMIVPDGTYTITIDTESIPWNDEPPVKQTASLSVEIDSSIQIYPESMASGKSGLLFASGTDIIPQGSFQFDALMLFGKPLTANTVWNNLPLAFSLRFSPLAFLEAAVSLNVTPEFGENTILGLGGSIKWQILSGKTSELPLGLAAILSYGWAQQGPITPFAMGTGVDFSLPVSLIFGDFTAFLTPELLWAGSTGFPDSEIPSGVLSAGISYHHRVFNSGLSVRTEYLFKEGPRLGPISIGGEIKFFPSPSVFVLSAMAGITYENNSWGGFGGIGIGFIQ
ncbi:MAG: PEGA domain-containing protein [Treponema sp.]|jgi:hypothetical protein|nr:PEGA domain-containing protein [Treponema sp.]